MERACQRSKKMNEQYTRLVLKSVRHVNLPRLIPERLAVPILMFEGANESSRCAYDELTRRILN